jgi:hypothetical protein
LIGEDLEGSARERSEELPKALIEGLRKTTINLTMADIPTETRTQQLPSVKKIGLLIIYKICSRFGSSIN